MKDVKQTTLSLVYLFANDRRVFYLLLSPDLLPQEKQSRVNILVPAWAHRGDSLQGTPLVCT